MTLLSYKLDAVRKAQQVVEDVNYGVCVSASAYGNDDRAWMFAVRVATRIGQTVIARNQDAFRGAGVLRVLQNSIGQANRAA